MKKIGDIYDNNSVYEKREKIYLMHQYHIAVHNETKRCIILSKILNMMYSKKLYTFFFRWKVHSQSVDSRFFQYFYLKNIRLKQVIQRKVNQMKDKTRKMMYIWRLQVSHKYPIYDEYKDVGRVSLRNVLINNRSVKKKKRVVSIIDISLILDRVMIYVIEHKYSIMKRSAIDMMRLLYRLEKQILLSKQPLMYRVFRLNQEKYMKYYNKRYDIDMDILSNIHHVDDRYSIDNDANGYYREYMNRKIYKKKIDSTDIVLSSVWCDHTPYLCMREYYMMRVLHNNYMNNILCGYRILLSYNNRINHKNELKVILYKSNRSFKLLWGRIYMKIILQDRMYIYMSDIVHRMRLYIHTNNILHDDRVVVVDKKSMVLIDNDSIRQMVVDRYNKIYMTYANNILDILFNTTVDKRTTLHRIHSYIIYTIHHLLVDILSSYYI